MSPASLTSPNVTGRVARRLLNGWQASPIFHWSTGNLTSATYGTDVALTGAANQRAQKILPNVYGNGSILNYLNINAFLRRRPRRRASTRQCVLSRFGPECDERGLGSVTQFQIWERGTMTFRAEAFNLPNSVMFGPPTAALNSASFGRIAPQVQSTAPGNTSTARIMQFALKYAF